jgi:Protein of unknown function (DUF2510)
MMMPQPGGWYDDPDGSDAERYFDGQVWTPQRRRKQPTPKPPSQALNPRMPGPAAAGPHVPPAPTGPAVPYYTNPSAGPSGAYWPPPTPSGPVHQGQHRSTGAIIGLAVAAGVALLTIAGVIAAKPWRDQASYQAGYNSGVRDPAFVHHYIDRDGSNPDALCKNWLALARLSSDENNVDPQDFMDGCKDGVQHALRVDIPPT